MRLSKKKVSRQVGRTRSASISHAVEFQHLESRRLMSGTITVNTFTDRTDAATSSTISLRDAVARASVANTSETIKLPAGTYTLTLGRLELSGGTVAIQPVSGTAILSGGKTSGVFKVDGAANATFSSLTIENGVDANSGGGIDNEGTLTLTSCTITNNSVTSNTGTGGGITNNDSLTINASAISNNSIGSSVTAAQGLGGGLYNGFDSDATITTTSFNNNTAGSGGGAYVHDGSAFGITASTFMGNSVSGVGGGIYNDGPFAAQNITIIDNVAEGSGGGMFDAGGSALINCTITGNDATYQAAGASVGGGGGIYSLGTTSIGNSVIAKNTVFNVVNAANGIGTDYQGPVTSTGHNVIGVGNDNASASGFGSNSTDQMGTLASPMNPELSAPTSTVPSVEIPIGQSETSGPPYYNQISSPLISQGDRKLATTSTDGRGLPRVVNNSIDIGAVETQITISPVTTTLNLAQSVSTSFLIGTFADPGSTGPYTVIVDYGSGTNSTATLATTGSMKITATYTGSEQGDLIIIDGAGTVAVASADISINAVATPGILTGTTIGTAGSYQSDGNTIAKATDSDLTTYFDGASANGNYVGLDLGSNGGIVTEVAYASRVSWETRMKGGIIQASNNAAFTSPTTLYTLSSTVTPPSNNETFVTFSNTTTYRYYRYLSPTGSYGDIAELQLFGTAGVVTTQPTQLTGTTIGTLGSYQNDGNTIAKATDGNLSTFYDGATANGNWVGLDLGAGGGTVTQVKYASRALWTGRMNGGMIQASNSATFASGVVTLYTIASNANPPSGSLTTATFTNTTAYRYYRYLSPNGSYGDIAEIQFFGTAGGLATVFSGTTIGTAGSYQNDGNTIAKATDGNLSTFFDGATAGTSAANDNWVGLDLGTAQVVNEVAYASRVGWAARMNGGMIQASNTADFSSGVVTLYTIGSAANPPSGQLTTSQFSNTTAYRYYRYLSPNGSYGDISELEFLSSTVAV